jgi:hypothetical protein
MSELVADCPRCGSRKITFDLTEQHYLGAKYHWQNWYEAFCVCRHCKRATIFVLSQISSEKSDFVNGGLTSVRDAVNHYMQVEKFVSIKDIVSIEPPKHLPEDVQAAFEEGATCLTVGCYNAAATMFRLCVDLAIRPMLKAA